MSSRPVLADERLPISESKTIIDDIKLKQPFINIEDEVVWDFEGTEDSEDSEIDEETNDSVGLSWLSDVINFMAIVIELVLWMIPLLALFYIYKYREYWLGIFHKQPKKIKKQLLPETLFGLDMKADSLPDNIETTAFELWSSHHYREAVSLLYRGSLLSLFERYRFSLPSGATEQDCIRYLQTSIDSTDQSAGKDEMLFKVTRFKQITDVWIAIAYAHKIPEKSAFNEICSDWNNVFFNSRNIKKKSADHHSQQVNNDE